ncbi:MAG: hypothetical protein C3L25_03410 [Candidatus Sedimenticola endophacoides]|uniref:HAMP domain-containing protein n=1 Tax=Candidatus Sedimenticola endophacoides TaxID=2548426 RepID=A0A6N4DN57_9GAMM|nr:MAG: hypothetical protein C3L24_12855 [Candidatus Sedimenticola endophacoides]PUE01422.1 MAG: hypothetical protein C3L26_03430 [Candidatus Sedimenticola endophacoides]PUE04719.1 MAG: hypothetical protein C3L25_03410 [Candidatus Sedimenticola endophacoides]
MTGSLLDHRFVRCGMRAAGEAPMFNTSLLFRVGAAMAIIVTLGLISMFSSVFIAKNSEGFAAAINQAGTLRMQSYRIASSLVHRETPLTLDDGQGVTGRLVEEFEGRLFSPRIHNVLGRGTDPSVIDAYRVVELRWKEVMQPPLREYLAIENAHYASETDRLRLAEHRDFYLGNVDAFVEKIHHFVKKLEIDAENKNRQLRIIQLVALGLTLLIGVVSVYLTKKNVLNPLHDLLACANAARRGDFSVRSGHKSDDELGQLGFAFNKMAEDLSKLYAGLEARVSKSVATS